MKIGNLWRTLFARCNSCKVIGRTPSVLRGFKQAREWHDSGTSGGPGSLAANVNPLRRYFDSVSTGRGIWKWSHYFDIYDRHFQKFIGKEVGIVEVGIFSGGSLDMWKSYFGPKVKVYGVDIVEACKVYEDAQTQVLIGDQGSRDFWRNFRKQVPHFDIVLDDGGHLPEQQIVTLEETLPYLRNGGVYVCEDVHGTHNAYAAYVRGFMADLNALAIKPKEPLDTAHTTIIASPLQRAIASIHTYPYVTVIEKTAEPVAELRSIRHGTEWQPYLS